MANIKILISKIAPNILLLYKQVSTPRISQATAVAVADEFACCCYWLVLMLVLRQIYCCIRFAASFLFYYFMFINFYERMRKRLQCKRFVVQLVLFFAFLFLFQFFIFFLLVLLFYAFR